MGGEKHRAAACLQVQDHVLDVAGVDRVKAGGGLVEEEQFGIVDQRSGEGEPHLHSLGVHADSGVGVVRQAHRVQQVHRIQRRARVQRSEELQVLQPGQLLVVVGQFERDTDALVVISTPGQRVPAPDRGLAAVAAKQADEKFLRRRLPCPAGTQETEDLTTTDGEVHAPHGGFSRLRVGERESTDADHVGHSVRRCGCRPQVLHRRARSLPGQRGAGCRHRVHTDT